MNTSSLDSLLGPGEIQYEQLTIGRKLGSGGFKDCYAGKYMGVSTSLFFECAVSLFAVR